MLTEKVEKILQKLDKNDPRPANESIRRAEMLSDKFHDVKPKTYSVPMERFIGIPAFHNEKNACY